MAKFERLVLESVDWVNVVLDADGRSLMIRQYRFGVDTTLETPGGMVDPGKTKTAAARELLEETGFASDNWSYGAVTQSRLHNHLYHHWLAQDVYRAQTQNLGDGESIARIRMEEQVCGCCKRRVKVCWRCRRCRVFFPYGLCPLNRLIRRSR